MMNILKFNLLSTTLGYQSNLQVFFHVDHTVSEVGVTTALLLTNKNLAMKQNFQMSEALLLIIVK